VSPEPVIALLEKAIDNRAFLFEPRHEAAFRLFNGFQEGQPDLVVDLYGSTVVLHNYAEDLTQGQLLVGQTALFLQKKLTWLRAGIVKTRNASSPEDRRGQLLFGEKPATKIREHGIWYAIDLLMNRDASFYLDTRNLRRWLIEHMRDRTVLNTFAYTGSLGVAAHAGGARRVIQHDMNRRFLDVAKTSYTLNGFLINKQDFILSDFFTLVGKLKRIEASFDCVIIDPPFFSTTSKGRVDQVSRSTRLINKVRPLVNHGGDLIAINNALYVSGKEYIDTLEELCKDGYLKLKELIPVPEDFAGFDKIHPPIADPAPFNHSTKISVLKVTRKT
jgi:23S rRNA (cytosine1962-C5)-methyltransferase